MQWTTIQSHWPSFTGSILQRWPDAAEADVLATSGNRNDFVSYLARITGEPLPEIERQIAEWSAGEMPADVRMSEALDNENIAGAARDIPAGEVPLDDDAAFGRRQHSGHANRP